MFAINDLVYVIPPLHYKLKPEYEPCKVLGKREYLGRPGYLIEFANNSNNDFIQLVVEETCLAKVPEVKVGDMVLITANAKRWNGWVSRNMDPYIGTTREVIGFSQGKEAVYLKGADGYCFHKSCIGEVIPAIKPSSRVLSEEYVMLGPVSINGIIKSPRYFDWYLDHKPASPKLPNPPGFLTDSQKILNDLEARFSTLYPNKEK